MRVTAHFGDAWNDTKWACLSETSCTYLFFKNRDCLQEEQKKYKAQKKKSGDREESIALSANEEKQPKGSKIKFIMSGTHATN